MPFSSSRRINQNSGARGFHWDLKSQRIPLPQNKSLDITVLGQEAMLTTTHRIFNGLDVIRVEKNLCGMDQWRLILPREFAMCRKAPKYIHLEAGLKDKTLQMAVTILRRKINGTVPSDHKKFKSVAGVGSKLLKWNWAQNANVSRLVVGLNPEKI
jgi:hypothetical protein